MSVVEIGFVLHEKLGKVGVFLVNSEEKCAFFGVFLSKSRAKLVKVWGKFCTVCVFGRVNLVARLLKLGSFCIFNRDSSLVIRGPWGEVGQEGVGLKLGPFNPFDFARIDYFDIAQYRCARRKQDRFSISNCRFGGFEFLIHFIRQFPLLFLIFSVYLV
jgi:hypothetical protein